MGLRRDYVSAFLLITEITLKCGKSGLSLIHSNLPNIMHVATKVHVIVGRFVMLVWMHDIEN